MPAFVAEAALCALLAVGVAPAGEMPGVRGRAELQGHDALMILHDAIGRLLPSSPGAAWGFMITSWQSGTSSRYETYQVSEIAGPGGAVARLPPARGSRYVCLQGPLALAGS